MSLQKLGSLQQARTAFDRMLRIEPEHLAANYNLALLLAKLGEQEASRAQLARFQSLSEKRERLDSLEVYAERRLTRVDRLDREGLEDLAVVLLRLGHAEDALSVTQRAVMSAPGNPDLHILRGEALEKAGRIQEAIEAYGRAIDLRPEDPENYWRRSVVALPPRRSGAGGAGP